MQIVPCSRVGHVYRDVFPHGLPGGSNAKLNILARNNGRWGSVWMEHFHKFFVTLNPSLLLLLLLFFFKRIHICPAVVYSCLVCRSGLLSYNVCMNSLQILVNGVQIWTHPQYITSRDVRTLTMDLNLD